MEIDIHACCYSEKADVGISFGKSVKDRYLDASDIEWIFEGMGDSFWENHEEFEPGIAQAKAMQQNNVGLTFRQALFATFGHFNLYFEINGESAELDIDIDVNDQMYALLEI